MPSIPPDEREILVHPLDTNCVNCGSRQIKQYCRSCDEFFIECACSDDTHDRHRTYRWVDGRIIADPDFDFR